MNRWVVVCVGGGVCIDDGGGCRLVILRSVAFVGGAMNEKRGKKGNSTKRLHKSMLGGRGMGEVDWEEGGAMGSDEWRHSKS
jgi:hypothetical protein